MERGERDSAMTSPERGAGRKTENSPSELRGYKSVSRPSHVVRQSLEVVRISRQQFVERSLSWTPERANNRRCGLPVPLLPHRGCNRLRRDRHAFSLKDQAISFADKLGHNPTRLRLRDKLPSADLSVFETPVHLILDPQPGSFPHVLGQGNLEFLSHGGCAHGWNFPLKQARIKRFPQESDGFVLATQLRALVKPAVQRQAKQAQEHRQGARETEDA